MEMKKTLKYIVFLVLFCLAASVGAQTAKWQDLYTIKKKDTIYGIAKKYNITIDELVKANPEMSKDGFTLKKGDQLLIPYPSVKAKSTTVASSNARQVNTAKNICIGVMLPLHNVDGDGQRMTEYYRGMLMACDSLKAKGIGITTMAWNLSVDADVNQILKDPNAQKCDVIFGPLYTKQVPALGNFCRKHNIRLVIPFSIDGDDVSNNANIFQIYQAPQMFNESSVKAFLDRFGSCHPVFVDCNDITSQKGLFTFALRKKMEARGIKYNITNLNSSDAMFAKAFVKNETNVVVVNTGRSPELNSTLAKLDILKKNNPNIVISLFGYTEWLMYDKVYKEYFHKYDAYIPTTAYYNAVSSRTKSLEKSYRTWFKSDMREALPRFAITGFDHTMYFITGMNKFGKDFNGTYTQKAYTPMQTPLKFKRIANGGMQNYSFMLIHYTRNHSTESINY